MKKINLSQLLPASIQKLNEGEDKNKSKSKKAPAKKAAKKTAPGKSAKEIMDAIHEEAEREHKDAKLAKVQAAIEELRLEMNNRINQPASGNVDAVHQDIKYFLKQVEELESQIAKLSGESPEGSEGGKSKAIVAAKDTTPTGAAQAKDNGDTEDLEEASTTNPVNVINSLDKNHSPQDLMNALKYATSHSEFADKVETIKAKMNSKSQTNETELNEDFKKILQHRAGIRK